MRNGVIRHGHENIFSNTWLKGLIFLRFCLGGSRVKGLLGEGAKRVVVADVPADKHIVHAPEN